MVEIYDRAEREVGYNATRFVEMVAERGGVGAAKALLAAAEVSDGFANLWEAGRLDLTVEALVLEPEFEDLFTHPSARWCSVGSTGSARRDDHSMARRGTSTVGRRDGSRPVVPAGTSPTAIGEGMVVSLLHRFGRPF